MDGHSMGESIKWMMRALFVMGLLSGTALAVVVAYLAGWLG
jgi:hypothetical protein